MALSSSTVWEVRGVTGSDLNGGGFVTGSGGTDYSQQDSKNTGSIDKSVTDGVANGTTTITSATANFGTSIVGNIIYVAGGTGSIVGGWYQVVARSSSTSITVDRSSGLTNGTGVTINIGGALASMAQLFTNLAVAGQGAFVKADGTYSISTQLTTAGVGSSSFKQRIVGYTSSRTDAGRVTIQGTAAITMLSIASSSSYFAFENFILDGNSATATNGVLQNSASSMVTFQNVTIKNLSGYGCTFNNTANLIDVEIFGCASTAGISNSGSGTVFGLRVYVHDNTVSGLVNGGTGRIILQDSVSESNSGASSDGYQNNSSSAPIIAINCDFYNNGRDGIRSTSTGTVGNGLIIQNCIFEANAGYGVNQSTGGSSTLDMHTISNNAYYNNGTGARNGFAAESGAVTLTGSPFNGAAGGDFSLNNTAGAGAACRAAGLPGVLLGSTTTGYLDIGVAHPAAGGVCHMAGDGGGFAG